MKKKKKTKARSKAKKSTRSKAKKNTKMSSRMQMRKKSPRRAKTAKRAVSSIRNRTPMPESAGSNETLGTFAPGETGQPEEEPVPVTRERQLGREGRGPLNQEGEGNRQNDELAEMQEVEPNFEQKQ